MSSKNTKTEKKKSSPKLSAAARLKKELENFKILVEEQNDRYLRLKAEFDNFRRRKEKDLINLLNYDGEEVIKVFLPVLDDLERLHEAHKQEHENNDKVKEGVNLILNKINKRFRELEVTSFTKTGETLDPALHDALMTRSEKGKGENEILEVFEKGYRYKDRVIRHAKVVVNQDNK